MSEWIVAIINQSGYVGLFALMLLESVFPPIPSELIVPFAGFAAARGDMNLAGVLVATSLGSVAGALPWYYAGRLLGLERIRKLADRFGRWLTVNADEIDKATGYFNRYGPVIVLLGRLAPIIRTLISVPAGLGRMNLAQFLLATAIGATIWNLIMVSAGYLVQEHFELVASYIDPLTIIVLVAVAIGYVFRLLTWRPQARDPQ
ncbi:membrane protein DedA with SNARE-associated domain [Devosia sp. UYZn731]|uniref:DedA family protein n=1 Tax=Devosia sp. UYZn731 TaxID=3156345 RepID=UPI003392FD0D